MTKHSFTQTTGLGLLAVFGLVAGHTTASRAQDAGDHYIVEVAPGNDAAEVATSHGVGAKHVFDSALRGFSAHIPPGQLRRLLQDPRVTGVSIDLAISANVEAHRKPVKPPPPPPSLETIPAGVLRIGAALVPETGIGVGVAVIDTGLDFNHLDLQPSPASFFSPAIPDILSAQDDAGHGTHVAGIIAAIKGNNRDVAGVAPNATLYAVKVLDHDGNGFDSDVISGLNWVVANANLLSPPIRVVNMSLGREADAPNDGPIHAAIQNVIAAGITVVVSAGNDPAREVSQMVPSGFPEVIAVASTTAAVGTSSAKKYKPIKADTASFFTTDGAYNALSGLGISISAPGEEREDINLPYVNSLGILSTALGGGTTRMSGTSMAAPHVTGVVALMLQRYPGLTPADVKTRIRSGQGEGVAPLDGATTSYTFDNEREGVLYAPIALQ